MYRKKEKYELQKGITLIVLIITIIILLILAGVVILMLVGDNGILQKSRLASKETDLQQAKEQLELAISSVLMNNPLENEKGKYVLENEKKLSENLNKHIEIDKEANTIKYNNYLFLVKEDGSIEVLNQIVLNKENLIMQIINGENTEEILKVLVSNLEGDLKWSSSNKEVVIVDNNGKVTTVGEGEAVVTAQLGIYTAECKVKVQNVKGITSIKLNKKNIYVNVGEDEEILAIKDNSETERIIWESSDNNVVEIVKIEDNKVLINGVGVGEATITARNYFGTILDSCTVCVSKFENIGELNIFSYAQSLEISSADFGFITNWSPSNSDRKTFDYSSGFRMGKWTGSGSYQGTLTLDFTKYISKIVYADEIDVQFRLSAQSGSNITGTVRIEYSDGTVNTFTTGQITNIATSTYLTKNVTADLKKINIKNIQFTISRI